MSLSLSLSLLLSRPDIHLVAHRLNMLRIDRLKSHTGHQHTACTMRLVEEDSRHVSAQSQMKPVFPASSSHRVSETHFTRVGGGRRYAGRCDASHHRTVQYRLSAAQIPPSLDFSTAVFHRAYMAVRCDDRWAATTTSRCFFIIMHSSFLSQIQVTLSLSRPTPLRISPLSNEYATRSLGQIADDHSVSISFSAFSRADEEERDA
jgi:hypothetical protein